MAIAKCGTQTRVFSQTLAHGNSKNEGKQEKGKKRGVSIEISKAGIKESRSPDVLNYSSDLPSPQGGAYVNA